MAAGRLLVDLGSDGLVTVGVAPDGGLYERVSQARLDWPLDGATLEDLRWYLEDYLAAPYGVWEDRGPQVQAGLVGWGEAVFASVFGAGPARDAYQRARDRGLELVFRSEVPALLGLPWELMRDSAGPVALGLGGVSRSLPTWDLAGTAQVPGGRLRVLMVISRPGGTRDVGYRMVARPLLSRLEAVRGEVDLVVLRPPTLDALRAALMIAVDAGEPFHIVHFDGHGVLPVQYLAAGGTTGAGARPAMLAVPGAEGVLIFERPGGGADEVPASKVAAVLKDGRVPVAVLNACQSGAIGADLGAAVATALLREGCAAVVAMAFSVYAVAAAEFMAAFYERLFAGDTVSAAVTAGRKQLFRHDLRPSPKGDMPLADWLVPVHYLRGDVAFPAARTARPAGAPSLDTALDELRQRGPGTSGAGTGGASDAGDAGKSQAVASAESLDPVGAFVDRDDLFLVLESAAWHQRVVVLHGTGGAGKTELAKAFGRWWRDTRGVDRPEWVLWHSFEPGVASFGLDGVITEVGLAVYGAGFARLDPPERRVVAEKLLAEHRLLLIWDNFETVRSMPDPTGATPPLDHAGCQDIKDFLAKLAAHGTSAVLITSRTTEDWLGDVRRVQVSGLSVAETAEYADALLAPYPAAARQREQRQFGYLLEWLDGHPLSMRLVLPQLATTDPAKLLEGLQGTTPLPVNAADGDRLTSLDASISYSYAHLSEKTRRLLPAVSLFHGVAYMPVLAAFSQAGECPYRFAKASGEDWKQILDDAANVGLLTPLGAGLYETHPALPAYLTSLWRAEDRSNYDYVRDAAISALTVAYAVLNGWLGDQISSSDAALAYAVIGLQRRTLGSLLGYALDHQQWDDAQDIAQSLTYYWETRGLHEEADAWLDRMQAAIIKHSGSSPPAPDSTLGGLWLAIAAERADKLRNAMRLDEAEGIFRQILDIAQAQSASVDRQSQIAGVMYHLGMIENDRRHLDKAEDWYRKSLTISEDIGDQVGIANNYHQLGTIALVRDELDEAEDKLRKSLDISEDLGDQHGMAASYAALGRIAAHRQQLPEAERWHIESLKIYQKLGIQSCIAASYFQLGEVARKRGSLDEAEDCYRKSLTISENLDNQPYLALTYLQLGILAQDRRQVDEAEDHCP